MVNYLDTLGKSRKRRSQNRSSIECPCRSPGDRRIFFETVEVVTSWSGMSKKVVLKKLAGDVVYSLL